MTKVKDPEMRLALIFQSGSLELGQGGGVGKRQKGGSERWAVRGALLHIASFEDGEEQVALKRN